MTVSEANLTKSLLALISESSEGLAVQELQPLLFKSFKLKVSYQDIEQALLRSGDLFSEIDWKWIIRDR